MIYERSIKVLKRAANEETVLLSIGQMRQSEVVAIDTELALRAADLALRPVGDGRSDGICDGTAA